LRDFDVAHSEIAHLSAGVKMYNVCVMDVFDAIADPTRRRMLDLLSARPMPATTLADEFAVSQPAVSRHLRALREAGLVAVSGDRGDGRVRLYSVDPRPLHEIERWLHGFWQDQLDSFADYVGDQA
jgi:DNA-binding transcriptional ArsR family regulator